MEERRVIEKRGHYKLYWNWIAKSQLVVEGLGETVILPIVTSLVSQTGLGFGVTHFNFRCLSCLGDAVDFPSRLLSGSRNGCTDIVPHRQ